MPIFLFTGENKYKILKTIDKRKEAFVKKYGKENLHLISSEEVKTEEIGNIIFSGGLFSNKKFIVIFGYPKDTEKSNKIPEQEYKKLDKFLQGNIKNIPAEDVIVFVSFQPDKRTKSYKFLKEIAEIKEFGYPTEKEIIQFIKTYFPEISTQDINYIIEKLGTDLFKLETELSKLKLIYKPGDNIKKLIDKYCFIHENIDQFKLVDIILYEPSKGINLLNNYKNKSDIFNFLGLLLRSIRMNLLINHLYNKGYTGTKPISEKLKLHPFVVSQRLKKIKYIDENKEKLKKLFKQLVTLEYKIKTGKIHPDVSRLEIKNIIKTIL